MTDSVQFSKSIREWMDVYMHRSMRGMGLFAKSRGLSISQVSILMQMYYKGSYAISKISEQYDISVAGASQLVDKLVQAGLVERAEDPQDRRAKLLHLSKKGKALVEQGIQERYRWIEEAVSSLSAEERTKVVEALGILTSAVKNNAE